MKRPQIILGISAGLLAAAVFYFGMLENFELAAFDRMMKLRGKRLADERIVMIDMAEDSIKKIGRWPWPREWHATVITILSKFGARALVFDVIFSEPSTEFSDTAMEQAMEKAGSVYIPYALWLKGFDEEKYKWNVGGMEFPIERFSKQAKKEGHITIIPDADGTIRRIPVIVAHEGNIYPQLGLSVASDILKLDIDRYEIKKTPFGRYIKLKGEEDIVYIPVDERNEMLINWAGRWEEAFKHYSFIEVVTSYQKMLAGEKPEIDLEEFRGKICVIGLTAAGLYDIKPNPLQSAYPAVGANANVINSILNKDFIRKNPRWLDALIIILSALASCAAVFNVSPVKGALLSGGIAAAYVITSYIAFSVFKIWISVVYPLAAFELAYLSISFYNNIVSFNKSAKNITACL